MPCTYDTGPYPDPDPIPKQAKRERSDLDNLTRMLCGICGALEHHEVDMKTNLTLDEKFVKEIKTWYDKHRDWDKKRLAAAKQSALAKLSEDEKEALGL